jgi:hypothetical protein
MGLKRLLALKRGKIEDRWNNAWSVSMRKFSGGLSFVAASLIFSLSGTAWAENSCSGEISYTFKKGETLSLVLRVIGKSNMWGPSGRVAKIVASQPQGFVRSAFGHVLEGATLVLPVEVCPRFPGWKIENGKLLHGDDVALKKAAKAATETPATETPATETPATEQETSSVASPTAIPTATPAPKATPVAVPTSEPTPEDTQLSESLILKARETLQNDETGYSKILENLSSEGSKSE